MTEDKSNPNLTVMRKTNYLIKLHSVLRDRSSSRTDYTRSCDIISSMVIREGMNFLDYSDKKVITPTTDVFDGKDISGIPCGVSIMRAGESMEHILRKECSETVIGKILIQRDEETAMPNLIYSKFPSDIKERYVFFDGSNAGHRRIRLLCDKSLDRQGCPRTQNHISQHNIRP